MIALSFNEDDVSDIANICQTNQDTDESSVVKKLLKQQIENHKNYDSECIFKCIQKKCWKDVWTTNELIITVESLCTWSKTLIVYSTINYTECSNN